jgi:hypothetical protein
MNSHEMILSLHNNSDQLIMENTGYHKLSRFMVDDQYAIFRKFRLLANRDLLYLQAELAHLEAEFSDLSNRDQKTKGEQELYDANWYLLSTSVNRGHDGQQWEKALQIRKKLREYCSSSKSKIRKFQIADKLSDNCVSQYSEILNRPQARKRDVSMLKDWISRPDLGGGIPFSGEDLSPDGENVYNDTFANDLMILNNRAGESDPFTRMLAGPVFHRCEKALRWMKVSQPFGSYEETTILPQLETGAIRCRTPCHR